MQGRRKVFFAVPPGLAHARPLNPLNAGKTPAFLAPGHDGDRRQNRLHALPFSRWAALSFCRLTLSFSVVAGMWAYYTRMQEKLQEGSPLFTCKLDRTGKSPAPGKEKSRNPIAL